MHLSFTCAEKYWLTHWRRRGGGRAGVSHGTGSARVGCKGMGFERLVSDCCSENSVVFATMLVPTVCLFSFGFFFFAELHMLTYPPPSQTWTERERYVEIIYSSLVFHYEGMRTDVVWATVTGKPALHRTYSTAFKSHIFRLSCIVSHLTNGENADWLTDGLSDLRTALGYHWWDSYANGLLWDWERVICFIIVFVVGNGWEWTFMKREGPRGSEWLRKMLQFCCVYWNPSCSQWLQYELC